MKKKASYTVESCVPGVASSLIEDSKNLREK